ncbi:DNA binding domain-containing protein, excisionase family [Phyllobacterium sp. YR620]|uniref:helix-turn-helix domain-containing protein n=1 Tax=Phyllobacterium sp. YR620 TaxID=1881066 RepID=UPI00087E29DC|nr:helix-turn-helix domain-containing protein [Phyllobacterium sp. YR620]SDP55355.1 DNA binding domain-containing protein, excisionase family [Phyllobacterium sp. YR620]
MQTTDQFTKLFYSVAEIAMITGSTTAMIYKMRERGELVFRKFGGKTVILKSDFDAYIANLQVCPAEPQVCNRRGSRAA